jgi:hypothetical protein
MTTIVATHAVGNLDTWLSGNNRKAMFPKVCASF